VGGAAGPAAAAGTGARGRRGGAVSITGHTRLAGVIGWPVAHSRSPRLHNAWLRRAGIDGAYLPLPVAPGHLEVALRGLAASGFAGANVTIPHKEEAFRLCGTVSELARRCGAVNTLTFGPDGAVHGDSTDGPGFLDSLRDAGADPAAGPALVLGAGGAARAIVASLQALGVPVTLANRTRAKADSLAGALADGAAPVRVIDWAAAPAALPDHALLVNTTALGMAGGSGEGQSPCALEQAPPGLVVGDIVYVPRRTPLLLDAQARGLTAVGGLGMLLHQAKIGFARWFGAEPVVDAEMVALIEADLPG